MTNAFIVITTLLGMDFAVSLLKEHLPFFARATEGRPLVVVHECQPLDREMKWSQDRCR